MICSNRGIIWVVNWKGCERTRPISDYESCHRTCPTLFRKHGLLVDQDIDRRYAIRVRDLPIRVGSAATTPRYSVFWVVKWIIIDWKPQVSKDFGECIDVSWEHFLAGLMRHFYDTELWSSEQQFNTLRPESHLYNNLVPKSQSLDVSIRYVAGVMCCGCIQAALSHFYEFMWYRFWCEGSCMTAGHP